ncbi:hypothetical protein [Ornatilinea apprima]|uniref:hypothetical protein n=1 Tax=Ornatilinea apprima TaxID=1134406 RepID=UPI001364A0F6|nr:hypothetical protein [Ornatilinea apprima]
MAETSQPREETPAQPASPRLTRAQLEELAEEIVARLKRELEVEGQRSGKAA